MGPLPFYVSLLFGLTVALTIYLFYRAAHSSKVFLTMAIVWVAIQTIPGLSGFYHLSEDTPPNLPLLVLPPIVLIIMLFLTKRGRLFIDGLSTAKLTQLHSVRVLVELVFYFLFINKYVPRIMTFEGRNVDLLFGLTAPFVYYFGFEKKRLSHTLLTAWNLIGFLLVMNAATLAVLSIPQNFRKIGVEQPDIALGLFPFILLPAVVVPIVLFSHLASIRQLIKRKSLDTPVLYPTIR